MADELSKLLGLAPRPRLGLQRPELDAAAAMDPSLANDMFQGDMASEIEDRLFQAQRTTQGAGGPNATPGSEVDALSNLLGRYQKMRAGSPLQQQQREYDAQRLGNVEAQNEGFYGAGERSPMQEREIYKRLQAEDVRKQPVQLANIREEGQTLRDRERNKTMIEQANIQMEPARTRADSYQGLMDALLERGIDPSILKGFSASGGVQFQSAPRQTPLNPNTALAALQKERGYLQDAGNTDPFATFGQPGSPNQAFDQAVRTVIVTSGLSGDSQEELFDILRDPQDRRLTIEQLIQKHGYDTQHEEFQPFINFLINLRGF